MMRTCCNVVVVLGFELTKGGVLGDDGVPTKQVTNSSKLALICGFLSQPFRSRCTVLEECMSIMNINPKFLDSRHFRNKRTSYLVT